MTSDLKYLEDLPIEIVDGDRGSNYPKLADFLPAGHCLFLSAKNVTTLGFDLSDTTFISEEKDKALRKGKLHRNDVVLTTRGTVGNLAYFDNSIPFNNVRINSGMVLLRANESEYRSRFLYYLLRSTLIHNQIESLRSGTAQPQLPIRDIRKLQLPLFPPSTQDFIADVIGTLDDKIEINRRMNRTLEAMAQAIFKSWFVDFEPVKAKAEARAAGANPEAIERAAMAAIAGKTEAELAQLPESQQQSLAQTAALFPDTFQPSELGVIPEGWHVKTLGAICKPAIGGQWGSDSHEDGLVAAICLRGCDMADISTAGYGPKSPIRYIKPNALEKRITSPNDLLIAASGAGPCGRPLWCSPRQSLERYGQPVIYSNFVKRFTFKESSQAVFAEMLLMPKYKDGSISDYINGTSVPNLDAKGLLSGLEFVIPCGDLLTKFFEFYDLVDQQRNSDESRTLAQLRDTLLPKLLSGELTVPEAERQAEDALA